MADIDTTNILADANKQAIVLAAPTDESLNAGALLPDEPIPDPLTNEVETTGDVIMEMIPKLDQITPAPVTESIHNALMYLRSDMVRQKGMSQSIATEAMALLPNFGKGRPLNFYSRLPSRTGFDLAVEEIDAGLCNDLNTQIAAQIHSLESASANPGSGFVIENLDFKRRADQVAMQASILKDFIALATAAGFNWDDACFQGCAVDESQNPSGVPIILRAPKTYPASFANMDEYYKLNLDAPAMMELMTTHLVQWKAVFAYVLDAVKDDAGKLTVDLPKAPTVYYSYGTKTTALKDIADVFKSLREKLSDDGQGKSTLDWATQVGNAAEQARVEDIIVRAGAYAKVAQETADMLKQVTGTMVEMVPGADLCDSVYKLVGAFAQVNSGMNQAYGEMLRWCVDAGLATSFAGTLVAKVAEHAWTSINQCRDTMQVHEELYTQLKTMVEDLQAPVKTNAV